MKKFLIIGAVLVVGVLLLYFTVFSGEKNDIRVFVFSKTAGYRHASIEPGLEAIKKLGAENNFFVDHSENAEDFTEENLKNYQVVVFLNTTGDILNVAQQTQMERFIQAGGGFVGIHAACDTEYAWPWYGKLVGAYFAGHPNNPNVREAELDIINPNHPSTDSLPSRWKREDEWYNYKSINPDNQVLIKIDETSYEGGTNNGDHPMAWVKEYDGGRMFYTGMGHTNESFSDPLFLGHLLGGIKYAIGPGVLVDYSKAYSQVVPEENRFNKVGFLENLNEPMELDFLTDTEIIFVERKGGIHIYDLETSERQEVITLDVWSDLEDGLLGVAVDPDYETNNFVYLFYSPPGDESKQHISRFVLKDRQLDLASEKVLLEIPTQREECCHSGGSLEFGPEGTLFISVGDNTNPHESDGFSPSDEREGRSAWDAQKSAADTRDYRGKILRIRPTADGYEIPEGNLFPADGSEGHPEIYVMGNRNPFRISIDQRTGTLYWGEVGPDASNDSTGRGPRGYDEFNMATQAGNYGWPHFIADNKAYNVYDFEAQTSGALRDPANPVNSSPNNKGIQNLPPANPALIYYPYDNSEEFPQLGNGSRNAMAGPIYYSDLYTSDRKFPDFFDGKPLFYDWMRQWIFVVYTNEDGTFDKMARIVPNMPFSNIMDMVYGPDGALYILEYGSGWFTQNRDATLSRIEYTEGNRKPMAAISVDKELGSAPLTVAFSAQNSLDYDGDPVTYAWNFADGGATSEEMNYTHTFEEPGVYKVSLLVKDDSGEESIAIKEIMVGNEMPELALSLTAGNKSFYNPDSPTKLSYDVKVTDKEDGSLADGSIDPSRVVVSVNYLPEGQDMVQAFMDHKSLADASLQGIGKSLIEGSDCLACHKEADKSIGPSFTDIARKYRRDKDASEYLIGKIINGGSGVWGETAMAAHPALSPAEAGQMVSYIRSFAGRGPKADALPPAGTTSLSDHMEKQGGTYIVSASYTDNGGEKVGSLTTMETLFLRHPKVEAETYDEGQAMKIPLKAGDVPGIEEDMTIVIGSEGAYLKFNQIDLTGVSQLKMQIGLAATFTKGGFIEIRTGALDGEMIGKVTLEQDLTTFGFWAEDVDIAPTQGVHDLYFVFIGEDKTDDKPVGVMDWIEFVIKDPS